MRASHRSFLAIIAVVLITLSCRKNKGAGVTAPPGIAPPDDTVIVNPPQTPPAISYTQQPKNVSTADNVNGFYEALPPGYDTATKKFPLLIFLHGGGERGTGQAALPLVLKHAVPKLIHEKKFPESFTVNDQKFSFIVISPQFKDWPEPDDVKSVIDYAFNNYKVDSHRVYLSGLSMGGGATWRTAAFYGRQLAAIVPICGAEWADSTEAKKIAAADIPIWAFHNRDDSAVTYNSTRRYVNIINSQNPAIVPRMTIWDFGGHDAWTRATDPAYREDNKNIYEWMLQFVR
jgi:predicted peptidase